MYIGEIERKAKGRKLQQQESKPARRVPKGDVRKALENAMVRIDQIMNDLDATIEDYWVDAEGKPMTKGLPAKNYVADVADQLGLAKVRLYRAIRLLGANDGNVRPE